MNPCLVLRFLWYNISTHTGDKDEDITHLEVVSETLLSGLDSMGEEYATSSPPLFLVRLGLFSPFSRGPYLLP